MYTWSGNADLNNVAIDSIQLTGSKPDVVVSSVSWSLRIRVHSSALNAAKTYFTIYNGSSTLYSDTVDAESYEAESTFRYIATFRGTFNIPDGTSLDSWFSGVTTITVMDIGHHTAVIPGGIAELVYAEVIPAGGWEAAYYDGSTFETWEIAHYDGARFDGNWEPTYYDGTKFL